MFLLCEAFLGLLWLFLSLVLSSACEMQLNQVEIRILTLVFSVCFGSVCTLKRR